jgi:hypothetical protein
VVFFESYFGLFLVFSRAFEYGWGGNWACHREVRFFDVILRLVSEY